MFDLTGKVSLITGASRGIGKGIALAFAKQGADVIINYLNNQVSAYKLADEITSMGRKAIAIRADVSKAAEAKKLFEKAEKEFGRLDILVNNAGISQSKDIFEMELSDFERVMNINLTSAFLCSKYALEIMKKQGNGRIISIASQAGERGALFGHVHYAASKSGVLAMSKTLARTAAPYGITVNCIAPGVIFTDFTYAVHTDDEIKMLEESIPLGLGNADDVSAAAVYLASEEARYVTGATIDVNGGSYIH
ncbi:MAG: 3-oxoacyl-ACP reductase FabG [Ruminococcaceae bacterium]|nr:3-oxoacyl-ACP reductase FabG [Oscillospiraceae bacterium]